MHFPADSSNLNSPHMRQTLALQLHEWHFKMKANLLKLHAQKLVVCHVLAEDMQNWQYPLSTLSMHEFRSTEEA